MSKPSWILLQQEMIKLPRVTIITLPILRQITIINIRVLSFYRLDALPVCPTNSLTAPKAYVSTMKRLKETSSLGPVVKEKDSPRRSRFDLISESLTGDRKARVENCINAPKRSSPHSSDVNKTKFLRRRPRSLLARPRPK